LIGSIASSPFREPKWGLKLVEGQASIFNGARLESAIDWPLST
jgi:hypothetical protein